MKEFLNNHLISDYNVESDQSIGFKIDGAEYYMSPIYKGSGINTNYPAGFYVSVKPVGYDKSICLFSYSVYVNDSITDRYSRAYNHLFKKIKEEYPDAKPHEYIPYCIYYMITKLYLGNVTLPYWSFLKQINMAANGIGSLVTQYKSIDEIRKIIDVYTESLKLSHPWIQLHTNECVLFKLVVEHFIRYANEKQDDTYIQNMATLIDFIQTRTANDLRHMIKSYPDMPQDNLYDTWFDNTVHELKMETSSWVGEFKDENILVDNSVLIERQRLLELFAAKHGIYLRPTRLLGSNQEADLLKYTAIQDVGYYGSDIKPTIDDIKTQIHASYKGSDVKFVGKGWPIDFTIPYDEEYGNKYDATVLYCRDDNSRDSIVRDRVIISLIPKYQLLNEKGVVCWITKEILQNGFKVFDCNRDLNPENPYDSGWLFFGKNQSDEYINNPDNIVMVNLEAFLKLCTDTEKLMDEFNNEIHEKHIAYEELTNTHGQAPTSLS